MDLEGCATADFLGVEYIVGNERTVILESLDEKGDRCGRAPWVISRVGSRCVGK